MGLTYFKRFRMEIDLPGRDFSGVRLPAGYRLIPWHDALLETHAEVKYQSFRDEIDANVFPCLGEHAGCQRLMSEISRRDGFVPESTWLIAHVDRAKGEKEFCGTIQGIRDRVGMGAIQNLGVVPGHRGVGLGSVLMMKALEGFRQVGITRVHLEVTAENDGAIRLYRRLGFVAVKTVFKMAEVAYS
jgi:ribosomal protein S18 acetylase RimI-like enzyme